MIFFFALGRDDTDEFIKGKQTTQYSVYLSIGTNFGQNLMTCQTVANCTADESQFRAMMKNYLSTF